MVWSRSLTLRPVLQALSRDSDSPDSPLSVAFAALARYVDDILVVGPSPSACAAALAAVTSVLATCGLPVATEKSTAPATTFIFLGYEWCSASLPLACVSIPACKWAALLVHTTDLIAASDEGSQPLCNGHCISRWSLELGYSRLPSANSLSPRHLYLRRTRITAPASGAPSLASQSECSGTRRLTVLAGVPGGFYSPLPPSSVAGLW